MVINMFRNRCTRDGSCLQLRSRDVIVLDYITNLSFQPEQAELSCGGLDLDQKETQSTMTGQMLQVSPLPLIFILK